jgi:uncharacterized membrane protein
MASEADLKMDMAISRMLRVGVSIAAFVVLAGWILYLWRAHGVLPDYHHFHGVPSPADRFTPVFEGIRHLDSRSLIRLGILLLIATPIMRVAFCVYSFAIQKDKIYVLVSAVVLTVLLYSFFRR